jgi:hypothetical protein
VPNWGTKVVAQATMLDMMQVAKRLQKVQTVFTSLYDGTGFLTIMIFRTLRRVVYLVKSRHRASYTVPPTTVGPRAQTSAKQHRK